MTTRGHSVLLLRICFTQNTLHYSELDKGSQYLGKPVFHYAVMPHTGNGKPGEVWQAEERFNLRLHAAQIGPTNRRHVPMSRLFLKIKPDTLSLSGMKLSESGKSYVVRLFNPSDRTGKR
jgi:alpha-mannosidase